VGFMVTVYVVLVVVLLIIMFYGGGSSIILSNELRTPKALKNVFDIESRNYECYIILGLILGIVRFFVRSNLYDRTFYEDLPNILFQLYQQGSYDSTTWYCCTKSTHSV